MLMIIFTESLGCFQVNSHLVGIIPKRSFQMSVHNLEESPQRCSAFNNTLSIAYINYQEAAVVKKISTEFQYYSDRPLTINFEKIDKTIFNFMSKLSILSYTVSLNKQLEVNGMFSQIKNTLVNTSNCWQPLTFEYSRSGVTSLINLTAEPNDCIIVNPIVEFQFKVNDEWKAIAINPKNNPTPNYKGYKLPFVHLETLYYEQSGQQQPIITKYIFHQFCRKQGH